MTGSEGHTPQAARAREPYARVLAVCCPVVLAFTVLAFALYSTGIVPPLVPVADLPGLWSHSAGAVLDSVGVGAGWAWLPHWSRGDMLCLAGLALLTLGTPLACFTTMIQYFRRREYALGVIALVQVLVLLAAMSGLIVVHT